MALDDTKVYEPKSKREFPIIGELERQKSLIVVNLVKELQIKENLSGKQVAEIIGKSPSQVSIYLNHPKKMPDGVKRIISERLGIVEPKEFKCELEDVTIEEVAKRMGRSEHMVRMALQQDKLPFGKAIKGDGDAYQYWIFRGAFERFMEEMK